MRFLYYDDLDTGQHEQLGVEVFGAVYDLAGVIAQAPGWLGLTTPPLPQTPWDYLGFTPEDRAALAAAIGGLNRLSSEQRSVLIRSHTRRLAPVPRPRSLRCFSAFEAHTRAIRQRRGLGMPPEWHEYPVFFFGNHNAIYGSGEPIPQPASFWMDYELQIACIIGREGRNIRASQAEEFIAGYTIMNDWCARDLEMYEMRIGVGPAKGRDFAVSLGPTLVTPDELEPYAIGEGDQRRYDLEMTVSVNDRALNTLPGNAREMFFTFAQMIERASADATLYPGDVLASGAVGSGSLLSLGAEEALGRWLQPHDRVDLEVTGLGVLRNTIQPLVP